MCDIFYVEKVSTFYSDTRSVRTSTCFILEHASSRNWMQRPNPHKTRAASSQRCYLEAEITIQFSLAYSSDQNVIIRVKYSILLNIRSRVDEQKIMGFSATDSLSLCTV